MKLNINRNRTVRFNVPIQLQPITTMPIPPNRSPLAADIAAELSAHAARLFPGPGAKQQARRIKTFAALLAETQWFLDTQCQSDAERRLTLDTLRRKCATRAALHQARN